MNKFSTICITILLQLSNTATPHLSKYISNNLSKFSNKTSSIGKEIKYSNWIHCWIVVGILWMKQITNINQHHLLHFLISWQKKKNYSTEFAEIYWKISHRDECNNSTLMVEISHSFLKLLLQLASTCNNKLVSMKQTNTIFAKFCDPSFCWLFWLL